MFFMNGQKGVTIAIVALMLTVCIGYLFNVEDKTIERTAYNDLADMGAIMYANSERGTATEEYNTPYNVTGWTGDLTIPESVTANQFLLKSQELTYTATPVVFNSSDYITTNHNPGNTLNRFATNTSGVYYAGGSSTYSNGTELHGGYNSSKLVTMNGSSQLDYYVLGSRVPGDSGRVFFSDLKTITGTDLNYKVMVDDTHYIINYTVNPTKTGSGSNNSYHINLIGTVNDTASYAVLNHNTEKWDLYSAEDERIQSSVTILYYTNETTATIDAYTPNVDPAKYADPTKPVSINSGDSGATWSNYALNSTLLNSRVSLLINSQLGTVTVTASDGTSTALTISWENYGADHWKLLTIDAETNTATIEPIINADDQDINPFNYTKTGVSFTRNLDEIPNIASITIRSLSYDARAYITNTYVFTDPRGVLWNDFNVNLVSYVGSSAISHLRIKFNGFVAVGDSIKVNGQTFAVMDGKITAPIGTGYGVEYVEEPLNGMAIDFIDGRVYLSFIDGKRADLGEPTTYRIYGYGAWYGDVKAYTIDSEQTTVKDWAIGWDLSANGTALIFIALLGVGVGICYYYRRDNFGFIDWLAIIVAAFIAFSLLVG